MEVLNIANAYFAKEYDRVKALENFNLGVGDTVYTIVKSYDDEGYADFSVGSHVLTMVQRVGINFTNTALQDILLSWRSDEEFENVSDDFAGLYSFSRFGGTLFLDEESAKEYLQRWYAVKDELSEKMNNENIGYMVHTEDYAVLLNNTCYAISDTENKVLELQIESILNDDNDVRILCRSSTDRNVYSYMGNQISVDLYCSKWSAFNALKDRITNELSADDAYMGSEVYSYEDEILDECFRREDIITALKELSIEDTKISEVLDRVGSKPMYKVYHTKKDMGLSLGDTVYVILNDRGIFKLTVSDIMIDLSAYDSYPVGDSVTLYLKDEEGNSYQMYTYADINRWVFRTEEAAKEMYDVLCEEKAQQRLEWDNVQSSEIN